MTTTATPTPPPTATPTPSASTPPVQAPPAPADAPKPAETPKASDAKPAETPRASLIADAKGEAPAEPAKAVEFKIPDGTAFGPKALGEFKSAVDALGIPADKAQALLDKVLPASAAEAAESAKKQIAEVEQKWADEFRADKVIGGAKFDASMKKIGYVIDKFGSPELREFLRDTGVGNSRELGQLLVKFYDAVHGHEVITSTPPMSSSTPVSREQQLEVLYGKTTPA